MVENNEKMYLELLDFDTDKKEKWVKQRLPYSVLFELTARCNMNCVHCYLQNVHDTKELSYDKIIEIIDILYAYTAMRQDNRCQKNRSLTLKAGKRSSVHAGKQELPN